MTCLPIGRFQSGLLRLKGDILYTVQLISLIQLLWLICGNTFKIGLRWCKLCVSFEVTILRRYRNNVCYCYYYYYYYYYYVQYLLNGLLATIGVLGSPGFPGPTLFSAMTRNSYFWPSNRSVTSNSFVVGLTLSGIHFPPTSVRRSMVYWVTGVPPSDRGGLHARWHESLVTSDTSGTLGAPGKSVSQTTVAILSHKVYITHGAGDGRDYIFIQLNPCTGHTKWRSPAAVAAPSVVAHSLLLVL